VATATGSWLFYWLGRRIRPLRPLIGLKRHARRPQAPIEPPAGADPSAAPG
jgi:glucan biosynthesis protein C